MKSIKNRQEKLKLIITKELVTKVPSRNNNNLPVCNNLQITDRNSVKGVMNPFVIGDEVFCFQVTQTQQLRAGLKIQPLDTVKFQLWNKNFQIKQTQQTIVVFALS